MVPNPRKTRRIVAIGLLGLLVLGAFATLVQARPEARGDHRDTPTPRDRTAEKAHHGLEKRFDSSPGFQVRLEGTATARDNTTYRVVLDGTGHARAHERNGTVRSVFGYARLDATLADDNGSVVKDGALFARFHARLNETGVWHWHLVALGSHKRGDHAFGPGLVLRGTASATEDGFVLEGHGKAAVQLPDEKPGRTRLALEVGGTLTRGA